MKITNFKYLVLSLFLFGCSSAVVKEVKEPMHQPEKTAEGVEQKVLELVEACEASYNKVQDYTAVLYKEERLKSSKLRPKETIRVKFRKPNKIYMKWIEEPNKGMELIYPVKENKMVVEPGGLLDIITPKLYLSPTDNLSTLQNRHPITEADLGYLIESFSRDFKKALKNGELKVILEEDGELGNRKTFKVETFLPGDEYYCSRSVVYFDKETKLPVHAEFYDKENTLFERYSYTDFRANVGLQEIDFDEDNPQYDF